jgi:hypothetical protein
VASIFVSRWNVAVKDNGLKCGHGHRYVNPFRRNVDTIDEPEFDHARCNLRLFHRAQCLAHRFFGRQCAIDFRIT